MGNSRSGRGLGAWKRHTENMLQKAIYYLKTIPDKDFDVLESLAREASQPSPAQETRWSSGK